MNISKPSVADLLKKGRVSSESTKDSLVIDLPQEEFAQLWESLKGWNGAADKVRRIEDNPAGMDTPEG
ncbi:MAG TPA: hypothetical protein PK919_02350 [Candidatus Aminicenantes bacterium]|nr:hypothetical protein [Candidatus Aminicenantes bacterium]